MTLLIALSGTLVGFAIGSETWEILIKNGQIKKAASIPATLDDRYVKALLKK